MRAVIIGGVFFRALILIIMLSGCSTVSHRLGGPVQKSRRNLVIGCWSPPRNLDVDYFKFLKQMGFTHTLYWRSPRIDTGQWRADLKRAAEARISLVFDSWQPDAVPDKWLEEVLATACGEPAFAGVYAPDEPGYRHPFEPDSRRPDIEAFAHTFDQLRKCDAKLLLVDSTFAEEQDVRLFLPYASVFGMDIYPYKIGIDWETRIREATRKAVRLAEGRPVWMVLQGHGRADWYKYATSVLHLQIEQEEDPRPSSRVLLRMARAALEEGASGIWWWSFELYDWQNQDHREFIRRFAEVNRDLKLESGFHER